MTGAPMIIAAYTRKNAQTGCNKPVSTTCQQDVFPLLVPSLLTGCQRQRLVDNLLQGCCALKTCYNNLARKGWPYRKIIRLKILTAEGWPYRGKNYRTPMETSLQSVCQLRLWDTLKSWSRLRLASNPEMTRSNPGYRTQQSFLMLKACRTREQLALAQLCISTAHVGKTTQQQHN
jgi:hypothetical protein